MLLTKKSSVAFKVSAGVVMVHHLRRGLAKPLPTMDRRAFLRRSGLGRRASAWRHPN
jgi:formate dehydrogenase major subunit